MAKVAFLGLGVMGFPMARHLKAKGGHEVTVYNRTRAKADKWVAENGGKAAATPREAAQGQDFVMCCVGNDDDLRQVTLGDHGAFHGVAKGAVFVDHTTASAEIARELYAEAKKRGFDFIDAPVSGGQAGAENGALTVMCGGDAEPFGRAEKVIAAYARMERALAAFGLPRQVEDLGRAAVVGAHPELADRRGAHHLGDRPLSLLRVGPGALGRIANDGPACAGAAASEHPPLHRREVLPLVDEHVGVLVGPTDPPL